MILQFSATLLLLLLGIRFDCQAEQSSDVSEQFGSKNHLGPSHEVSISDWELVSIPTGNVGPTVYSLQSPWRTLAETEVTNEEAHPNNDNVDTTLHVNYLTTCIKPFRSYVPSPENKFRIPHGNVRITFDGGGGEFNKTTGGMYPGYNPDLEFTFQFDLQGLPSNCDGCRIQINSGMTCDLPEIRFWDRSVKGAINPWRPEWGAVYHSNKNGQASGEYSMFDGFSYDEHKTRSVVVFDEDRSTRIGCGVLRRSYFGECGHDPENAPSNFPSEMPVIVTIPPAYFPTLAPNPVPNPAPVLTPVPIPTGQPFITLSPTSLPVLAPTPAPIPAPIPASSAPQTVPSNSPSLTPITTKQPVQTPAPTVLVPSDVPIPTAAPNTPVSASTESPGALCPTPCPILRPTPSSSPFEMPEGKGTAPSYDPGNKDRPPIPDEGGKGSDLPLSRKDDGSGKGMSRSKGSSKGKSMKGKKSAKKGFESASR